MNQKAVFESLKKLVGVWKGEGTGRFPTVDDFRYRETLTVESCGEEPVLHFQQKTSLISADDRHGELLHWESGFLIVKEDGTIDLLNAQNSGRVEVLSGRMSVADDGVRHVKWDSVIHAHDARMVATTRVFRLENDVLKYTVGMATTKVAAVTQHLKCVLERSDGPKAAP